MNTVISVLEGFEKLAYKFLLSIIFIPKTVIQITVNPGWVPDYIREELKKEKGAFNAYLSPVILLLVVALIPALVINFISPLGVELVTTPDTEDPYIIKFEAKTNLISGSPRIFNQYSWEVIDERGDIPIMVWRQTYNEFTDKTVIEMPGESPVTINGLWNTEFTYPEENYDTSIISFYYPFDVNTSTEKEDRYIVSFRMSSFDPERIRDEKGENYFDNEDATIIDTDGRHTALVLERVSSSMEVIAPPAQESNTLPLASETDQGLIIMPSNKSSEENNVSLFSLFKSLLRRGGVSSSNLNLSDLLKKETTIFLALGLLFPPLLFALATKLFKGEKLSEDMLKESFYIQCYYFAPLSLAIWATYYTAYFMTSEVFNYSGDWINLPAVFIPSFLAFLWFIGVETQAIARERPTKGWKALLIVGLCITILLIAANQISLFSQPYSDYQDSLRRLAILAYPLAAVILLLTFVALWWKRRREEGKKITIGDLIVGSVYIFVILCGTGVFALAGSIPAEPVSATQSVDAAQPAAYEGQVSPTVLPTATEPSLPTEMAVLPTEPAAQPFYIEEFDTNDNNWSYFVVDGGTSTITKEDNAKMSLLRDKSMLTFDLNAMNLWVYTMYDPFEYDNVRMDARVTNRGVNNNNVSLICRYTEDGWYEFNIANNGLYWIYAASVDSAGKVEYGPVYDGGSDKINYGKATNEYSIICNDTTLSLFINGTEVRTVTETKYALRSGKVGVSVSSFDVLPVNVELEWVTISEP